MFALKSPILAAAALAGVAVFRPTGIAPERDARAVLPPEALVRAIAQHNAVILDLALATGADPNASDADGHTPLLVATVQKDLALVQRLLQLGADVDLPDRTGRTPLMVAAAAGHLDLLQPLLARSQRPEAVDGDGLSAAHYAIRARKFDSFQLLWTRMAQTGKAGAAGPGLVGPALASGDMPTIRSVIDRLENGLEWTTATQEALRFALTSGDLDLIRMLLSKHAAAPTVKGETTPLLAQAIAAGDASTFRALLAAGADPNTLLPTPSEKRFVKQLPGEDLRGYVRADRGMTVLMLAAGLGKTEYVRALLDAGADRNRQTARYKMLALYFAAHTHESKCVQMLLGRGPTREQLRVEISLATQRASVFKDGVQILQTSVSTGRKGFDTPAGEYVITDKNRNHVSSVYHVEMPFFMRLNCRDFGLHAGNVPSYPASHGCIRVPADVAKKLFSEIPVGTVVTIN